MRPATAYPTSSGLRKQPDKQKQATPLQRCRRGGNWRGGPSGRWLGCIRGFPLRARLAASVAAFPAPATSHAACGFPALRAPAHFASRLMRPIRMTQLPPGESCPRSPPLGVSPTPRAIVAPPPLAAGAIAGPHPPGSPNHRRTSPTRFFPAVPDESLPSLSPASFPPR